MASAPGDPLELAIDLMLRLDELIRDAQQHCPTDQQGREEKRYGDGVRRRLRSLPGLVASTGLIPALTFYMSKAKPQVYSLLYNYLAAPQDKMREAKPQLKEICKPIEKNGKKTYSNECKDLCTELGSKEASGYAASIALTAVALRRLLDDLPKDNSGTGNNNNMGSLQGLARYLLALRRNKLGISEAYASAVIQGFVNEAKKLADAFFAAEEGEEAS